MNTVGNRGARIRLHPAKRRGCPGVGSCCAVFAEAGSPRDTPPGAISGTTVAEVLDLARSSHGARFAAVSRRTRGWVNGETVARKKLPRRRRGRSLPRCREGRLIAAGPRRVARGPADADPHHNLFESKRGGPRARRDTPGWPVAGAKAEGAWPSPKGGPSGPRHGTHGFALGGF